MLQRSEKVVRKYQQSPRIKSSADGYVIILECMKWDTTKSMRLQINTHDIEIHFRQADVVDCWWEYCHVWLRQACPFLRRVLGCYLMIIGLSLSCTRLLVNHLKVKMWRPIYRMTMIGVRVLCVCGVHTKKKWLIIHVREGRSRLMTVYLITGWL